MWLQPAVRVACTVVSTAYLCIEYAEHVIPLPAVIGWQAGCKDLKSFAAATQMTS